MVSGSQQTGRCPGGWHLRRSAGGYLWRVGCGAKILDDMFAGIEVEFWDVRWMG